MTENNEFIWAVGLFEGEGCIVVNKEWRKRALNLCSTDKDVVDRFYKIVNCGSVFFRPSKNPRHKDQYVWYVSNWKDVSSLIKRMLPYLCERRKAKALELLNFAPRELFPCGTNASYASGRCRCTKCKKAHAKYNRAKYLRAKSRGYYSKS